MEKRVDKNYGIFTPEDMKTPISIMGGSIKPLGKLTGEELAGDMALRVNYHETAA